MNRRFALLGLSAAIGCGLFLGTRSTAWKLEAGRAGTPHTADPYDAPPNSKIWNPVMIKMMKGEKVTVGTVFSTDSPETYCAMANAGYDFIWTEMQHDSRDWGTVAKMWKACPHAKAVPGVRVAYTDEREIQHAMDNGALVVV